MEFIQQPLFLVLEVVERVGFGYWVNVGWGFKRNSNIMWNESPLERVYVWVHMYVCLPLCMRVCMCLCVQVCSCVCSPIPCKDRKSGRKYIQKSNYQRPLKNGNKRDWWGLPFLFASVLYNFNSFVILRSDPPPPRLLAWADRLIGGVPKARQEPWEQHSVAGRWAQVFWVELEVPSPYLGDNVHSVDETQDQSSGKG